MVTIKDKVDYVLRGGLVERFHTRPLIHHQNNAQHQYGVASIAALLYPQIRKEALLHMLWHDVDEGVTGDIPYQSKIRWPDLKKTLNAAEKELHDQYNIIPEIAPQEKDLMKICEYFDVMLFCMKEQKLGNQEFTETIKECVAQIRTLANIKYEDPYQTVWYKASVAPFRARTLDLLNLILSDRNEEGYATFNIGGETGFIPIKLSNAYEPDIESYPQMGDF